MAMGNQMNLQKKYQNSNEPATDPLPFLDMEQQQNSSHDDGQPNKAIIFLIESKKIVLLFNLARP
jgi:hypothetical protein